MPFDEALAEKVRVLLRGPHTLNERRMFGGLAFMVNGHMCCGIVGKNFVVRTGPDQYEEVLSQRHARPMDFTGRAMRGFVYVNPKGLRSNRELKAWIQRGLDFVLSQSPK
jgi:TfoX/Sxy family transcriptional regulator of competence genes